ncbi:MAG: dimethyl sulfoxide reductase anchor subunit, partial [Campylobacteraceae bacterium]|nr:dimethyl sulfoxide reductase anchor subunit [Campylobacteraceae bacterium]
PANLLIVLAIFLPAAIGLPLSALHLGRPILALTAMKNYKTSWLSREAIALGVYTGLLSFLVVMYYFEVSAVLKFMLEALILPIGIYGIYAQSMIYRIKARPSWDKKETTKVFFSVGYIGLILIALCLSYMNQTASSNVLIAVLLFLSFYNITLLKTQSNFYKNLSDTHKNFYQLNKTKKLYEEFFPKQNTYRKQMLYVGGLILPILALLFNAQGDNYIAVFILGLALIISFMSEIIGRYLFYVTAVAQGLAGNFFVGNQR